MNLKKAFSLIQILFAIAIIAVLMAMALTGISILQRSSRDSQRSTALGEIEAVLSDYNSANLGYPSESIVQFTSEGFVVNGNLLFTLEGSLTPASSTTAGQTRYYYRKTIQGYALCAELESGGIENTGASNCPDISMW